MRPHGEFSEAERRYAMKWWLGVTGFYCAIIFILLVVVISVHDVGRWIGRGTEAALRPPVTAAGNGWIRERSSN